MSSGGSAKQTTTTQQAYPYAPAMPYIEQAMRMAADMYSKGGAQYTPWSQVANATPQQLAAQQGILDYAQGRGTQQFIQGLQGATANQMAGGTNYLNPLESQNQSQISGYLGNNNLASNAGMLNQMAYGDNQNPYMETQVRSALDQLSNAFLTNTLPGLRRAAIGQGTYGSSRNALAEGQAGAGLDTQMQQTANQMYMNAYNTSEANRMNALNQMATQQAQNAQNAQSMMGQQANTNLSNLGQGLSYYETALKSPLDQLNQIYQVGQQQQTQAQNQLNDATNRWQYNQNLPWQNLANFKQLIDATSNLGQSRSSTVTPPNSDVLGNTMGGLLQAGAALAPMMGGGGNAASGQSGVAGSGTSGFATPQSLGFQSGSVTMPSQPMIGSSNFGRSIGNSNWGSNMFSSFK